MAIKSSKKKKHWFHDMTDEAKKAYLAAHPNSVYHKKKTTSTKTGLTKHQKYGKSRIKKETLWKEIQKRGDKIEELGFRINADMATSTDRKKYDRLVKEHDKLLDMYHKK